MSRIPLRAGDPARVGGYTLLGCLGEGGMGTVYLGASSSGQPVAVKVIRREFAENPGFAARFRAEVDNARRVASFCTARVIDSGVAEDGRPYMVTEYIEGTSLSEQIAEFGRLEPSNLLGTAFGIGAALAAIHAAGLVHRDLKPANVILSTAGPRVIDFGIARALDDTTAATLTGELVGTPGWWAPEQVTGGDVTPAADIFAWGCLIAFAGGGTHPFGDGDALTMAERVVHAEPDLGHLPEPLDGLVRRALSRDPAARPTAQDILLALVGGRELDDGPSTQVLERLWDPPENLRPPEPAPPRRRRKALLSLALLLVVGAGLAGGAWWAYIGSTTPPAPPRADRGRTDDIGRRIMVGDGGLQMVVEQVTCDPGGYREGMAAPGEKSCHVHWLLLNMGGVSFNVTEMPVLVDDRGTSHREVRTVRGIGDVIRPGDVIAFTREYTLPEDREPALFSAGLPAGAEPIEVRL